MKQKILSLCAAAMCAYTANAQMAHFYIGGPRHEIARSVKALSDGSSIIAGYIYDLDSNNDVTNADNLLMRVSPTGNIIWQKQWGTDSNDFLREMIITQNEDIVVVGVANRGKIYEHSTAAIYRFDINGNMLNQNFVRNINHNQGGEEFNGVCETANGDLVAVGIHNNMPASSDALLAVFQPNLTQTYTEVMPMSKGQSDGFMNVATDSNNVYVIGLMYSGSPNSTTYYDQVVMKFNPYSGPLGTIVWSNYYDIAYTTGSDSGSVNTIDSDWPVKVFVKNNKVLVTSYVADGWGAASGLRQYLFRCNASNGALPEVRIVSNGTPAASHSNTSCMIPVSHDEMFITNVPANTLYDYEKPTLAPTMHHFISHVSSFATASIPISTWFTLNNSISVQSLDRNVASFGNLNNHLYMAGNADVGNNDIYFGIINAGLQDSLSNCDIDTTSRLDTVMTRRMPFVIPQDSIFIDEPLTDSFYFVSLNSILQCGDSDLHNKIGTTTIKPIAIENVASVRISPNPTTGVVNLFYAIPQSSGIVEFVFTDLTGKVLLRKQIKASGSGTEKVELDNNISSNVLLCTTFFDGKAVNIQKLILNR